MSRKKLRLVMTPEEAAEVRRLEKEADDARARGDAQAAADFMRQAFAYVLATTGDSEGDA